MATLASELTFTQRRLMEASGVIMIAIAVFLAFAFLTYNPFDPSFNLKTEAEVENIAGRAGAYIADPVLQFFGLGSTAAVFVPFVWGIKTVLKQKPKYLWGRGVVLLGTAISASALLSLIPSGVDWPFQSYGGYIGVFAYTKLESFTNTETAILLYIIFLCLGFYFAVGLSIYDWGEIWLRISRAGKVTYGFMMIFFQKLYGLVKHGNLEAGGDLKDYFRKKEKESVEIKEPKFSTRAPKASSSSGQTSMDLRLPDEFQLPELDFLKKPPSRIKKQEHSETALRQNAKMLESVLNDFGVKGNISEINPGPVVTLYELEPAPGIKSSRVIGLADDIARSMSAVSARIAVIPGKNAIGIELPNSSRETVYLRELLESSEFEGVSHKLALALGKNIGGEVEVADLARMPHLLVAGTTGSGKSVSVNTMILSLLYKYRPDECKFIMIDPKMLELSMYDGIPHLLAPVVTEPRKAVVALKWVVKEMENRYRLMSNLGVRNLMGYNNKIKQAIKDGKALTRSVQTGYSPETGEPIVEEIPLNMETLPYIVVIVDEMADLMIVSGKEIESSVQRLAQMARAAGIHIIMATQRPSVDVITGVIKANLPTRISFQVTSRIDSRTILGEQGAEQLLGMGDMLYMAGGSRITRIHGPFVSDEEVETVVRFLKSQGEPEYMEDITADDEDMAATAISGATGDKDEDLYQQAVQVVIRERKASTSFVQRALRIGYNRAANLIERMEKEGIVSPANHAGKREILLKSEREAS